MADKKIIVTMLGLIIGVIILVSIFAALVPEVNNAGDQLNQSNQCNGLGGCLFNATNSSVAPCREAADQANACPSGGNEVVPLSGLFASNGVITLIVLALLVFIVFFILIGRLKMKN